MIFKRFFGYISNHVFKYMPKRMVILILALVLVFGGIVAFNLFKNYMMGNYFAHFEAPPVTISTVKASEENWQPVLQSVGDFVAIQGVEISSQISGVVSKISFESGQYVKQGEPLLTIDDSVEQATLKDNQANLLLQQHNFTRQINLRKTGFNTGSDLDTARANLDSALAAVQKTQAMIDQKHITAPFDGQLGIRQVSLGEYIIPGQTNIVTLQSLNPLYLQFYLPEQNLSNLSVGQPIQFNVESEPNKTYDGKITAIDSKIDLNTHNILVQATVDNPLVNNLMTHKSTDSRSQEEPSYAFAPGMFAKVAVLLPQQEKAIVLPLTAVTYTLYGDSVYIVKEEKKDKAKGNDKDKVKNTKPILKVYRQFVKTGEKKGDRVVILSGVKAGDQVVNAGQMKLHNGTVVIINNKIKLDENKSLAQLGQ